MHHADPRAMPTKNFTFDTDELQLGYDITLVTCGRLPDPDDDLAPLKTRGLTTRVCVWNEPDIDWSVSELTLIRSTWDYCRRLDEFLCWADQIDQETTLYNPPHIVRWNAHKSYLLNLSERGVRIDPSAASRHLPSGGEDGTSTAWG